MAEDDKEKPEAPEEEKAAPGHMSEAELRAELEKHFREQTVSDFIVQFMVTLSNLGYLKMGLSEDTQDIRDLDQASMAIDGFKALLDSVRHRLPKQDADALAGALSSMQMTFVKASSPESGGGAGGGSKSPSKEEGSKEASGDSGESPGGEDGDKPTGDGPASRIWTPGKK